MPPTSSATPMARKTANRSCATQLGTGWRVSPKREPELVMLPVYRMGGDSTVTENVTYVSPSSCDPGNVRVLVTEDDEVLATTVAAGLRREGMAVDVALDGAVALERLAVNRYDVVVLDRDLPGVHGEVRRGGGAGPRPGPISPPANAVQLRRARGPERAPRRAARRSAARSPRT